MRRVVAPFLLFLILLFYVSCDDTSQEAETDPETVEFATEPTDELAQMIEEAPSDFTWEFFSDHLIVSMQAGPEWSDEIVLSSFQVENGEVVNRSTTEPYETNSEELSSGLSTEEMFPGLVYAPGNEWVTSKRWKKSDTWFQGKKWLKTEHRTPTEQWGPRDHYSPSEIEEIALSEFDLSETETLIVIYTHFANPDHPLPRTVRSQPYGIVFVQE